MNRPGESHLTWISELIRAFYREGVRHLFLSPGSRSTPIALAAASHPGLNTVVVLDERSAAFQALGSAKVSGMPALLACTSGTAVAHYLPALIEARHTSTPMIVLSADRQPALRQSGSSQTIDQIKLFGDYAVMFHEIGEPVHEPFDKQRLNLLAIQAVDTAIKRGGAVHLNAAFRKPLEPTDDELKNVGQLNSSQAAGSQGSTSVSLETEQRLPESIADLINHSKRPVIVAGTDNPGRSLKSVFTAVTDIIAAPVICEPGANLPVSGTRSSPSVPAISGDQLGRFSPDLIIRFGASPFTSAIREFLSAGSDIPVVQFLSSDSWQDEQLNVTHRFILESDRLDVSRINRKEGHWLDRSLDASEELQQKIKQHLDSDDALTDGYVMNRISAGLTDEWNIMLSNSFTIRDWGLFASPGAPETGIVTNRGAAGIDGIISTAAGAARTSGKPMICFSGDLALFHDSNALMALHNLPGPMVIVCINNGGGSIFRMLAISRLSEYFTDLFETPQHANIALLAESYGHHYIPVRTRKELDELDINKLRDREVTLIECITDPASSMTLRNRVWNCPTD